MAEPHPLPVKKGTTWEGGFRVPCVIRWPGVIEPGTISNDIHSHEDMMPTLLAAAGVPDVKEKLLTGYQAGDKNFKVHLDGYNLMPLWKGEVDENPRNEIFYFDQGGHLNAVRYRNWKLHFTILEGPISEAYCQNSSLANSDQFKSRPIRSILEFCNVYEMDG
jgi:arylsulfatase A-like enzyme